MATVILEGKLIHTMVDTCGAKSMIDKKTALDLGFEVEVATRQKHFGSFYGPGDKVIYYYGRIKGPLKVHFSSDVHLNVPELKVVEHTVPLLLLGTDVLTDQCEGDWKFAYVGLHPDTRKGNMVMMQRDGGQTKDIPLVSWPDKDFKNKPMPLTKALPKAKAKRKQVQKKRSEPVTGKRHTGAA